jgi:hypothetical protein
MPGLLHCASLQLLFSVLAFAANFAYLSRMRAFLVTAALVALLAFSVWYAVDVWNAHDNPPMPMIGWLALIGGGLFTLLLAAGLIALMYYSHRHGYDDLTIEPEDRKRR